VTYSPIPPLFATIEGSPQALASITTARPNSRAEGKQKISAFL